MSPVHGLGVRTNDSEKELASPPIGDDTAQGGILYPFPTCYLPPSTSCPSVLPPLLEVHVHTPSGRLGLKLLLKKILL